MEATVTHVEAEDRYDYKETGSYGIGYSQSYGASVPTRRVIRVTVEIDVRGEVPRQGDNVQLVFGRELKKIYEDSEKRVQAEKADRDRMMRMADDQPGWSGCPDCGQLPCTCCMDPKLF